MQRRDIILGAGSALALPQLALAQDFPKAGMNIKYVVPFAPGGLTDIMARIVAQ